MRDPVRVVRALGWAFASLSAALLLVGAGSAIPAQVVAGASEEGGGAYVGEVGLAYWTWVASQLWGMPNPIPTAISTVAATPTLLPAVSSVFRTNAATAGDLSIRWVFQETTAAPASTEIELRFVNGLSGPASSLRVYLETRAIAPAGPLDFFLYWDAGAFAPGSVTVETMQVTVFACTAIGVCP